MPNADGEGLLIQDVEEDSAAAEKGFTVGDAILEVDNKPVASVEEFEAAITAVKDAGRNTALIKAERNGNVRFIGLPLDEARLNRDLPTGPGRSSALGAGMLMAGRCRPIAFTIGGAPHEDPADRR